MTKMSNIWMLLLTLYCHNRRDSRSLHISYTFLKINVTIAKNCVNTDSNLEDLCDQVRIDKILDLG